MLRGLSREPDLTEVATDFTLPNDAPLVQCAAVLSNQQSRQRYSELNALLCEWDPIGVGPDVPTDEYECLAGPLMRLLESRASEAQIATYLGSELVEHFGLEPNDDEIEAVATRVRAWFDRDWRDRSL